MNLKQIRMSRNMTQEELAKQLNVTRTTVTMWENNKSLPNIVVTKKLSKILDCSIDDLLKE